MSFANDAIGKSDDCYSEYFVDHICVILIAVLS